MPAHPFAKIYDAYREANPQTFSLEDFSKFGNAYTQSKDFDAGDNGFFGGAVKRGSYFLDKGLEATYLPQASGELGAGLFKAFGGDEQTGREAFRGVPRSFVDFAPLLATGIGAAATAPVSVPAMLAAAAPALLASGALGAANAYEKTDSLGSAATAAVMPALGMFGGSLASSALSKAAGFAAAESMPLWQKAASYGASQVGALGTMEGVNAVENYAQTGELPTYDKNKVLTMLTTQLPFAAFDAAKHFATAKPKVIEPKVEDVKSDAVGSVEVERELAKAKINADDGLTEVDRQTLLDLTDQTHDAEVMKIGEDPQITDAVNKFKEKLSSEQKRKLTDLVEENETAPVETIAEEAKSIAPDITPEDVAALRVESPAHESVYNEMVPDEAYMLGSSRVPEDKLQIFQDLAKSGKVQFDEESQSFYKPKPVETEVAKPGELPKLEDSKAKAAKMLEEARVKREAREAALKEQESQLKVKIDSGDTVDEAVAEFLSAKEQAKTALPGPKQKVMAIIDETSGPVAVSPNKVHPDLVMKNAEGKPILAHEYNQIHGLNRLVSEPKLAAELPTELLSPSDKFPSFERSSDPEIQTAQKRWGDYLKYTKEIADRYFAGEFSDTTKGTPEKQVAKLLYTRHKAISQQGFKAPLTVRYVDEVAPERIKIDPNDVADVSELTPAEEAARELINERIDDLEDAPVEASDLADNETSAIYDDIDEKLVKAKAQAELKAEEAVKEIKQKTEEAKVKPIGKAKQVKEQARAIPTEVIISALESKIEMMIDSPSVNTQVESLLAALAKTDTALLSNIQKQINPEIEFSSRAKLAKLLLARVRKSLLQGPPKPEDFFSDAEPETYIGADGKRYKLGLNKVEPDVHENKEEQAKFTSAFDAIYGKGGFSKLKTWFNNGLLQNQDGIPLVFDHWTKAEPFDSFDTKSKVIGGRVSELGRGVYFSSKEHSWADYAENKKAFADELFDQNKINVKNDDPELIALAKKLNETNPGVSEKENLISAHYRISRARRAKGLAEAEAKASEYNARPARSEKLFVRGKNFLVGRNYNDIQDRIGHLTSEERASLDGILEIDKDNNVVQGVVFSPENVKSFHNSGEFSEGPLFRASTGKVYQANQPLGAGFFSKLGDYEPGKRIGNLQLPKNNVVDVIALQGAGGGKGVTIKKTEMELYRDLVPEAFNGTKVDVSKLVEGLKNSEPVVKSQVYGMDGGVSKEKQELDELRHSFVDAQDPETKAALLKFSSQNWADLSDAEQALVKRLDREKVTKYAALSKAEADGRLPLHDDDGPKATAAYNLVSIWDPKIVRSERLSISFGGKRRQLGDTLHNSGIPNHGGWAWVQYPTGKMLKAVDPVKWGHLSDTEEVAVVVEQQSQWAQAARAEGVKKGLPLSRTFAEWQAEHNTITDRTEAWNAWRAETEDRQNDRLKRVNEHPLLDTQHELVLKALSRHLAEQGIKEMVVSDGETAMMTERHDTGLKTDFGQSYVTEQMAKDKVAELQAKGLKEVKYNQNADGSFFVQGKYGIKQEGGMRLHYDTTLPSTMKKITGDAGTRVDLGGHKNQIESNRRSIDDSRLTPEQRRRFDELSSSMRRMSENDPAYPALKAEYDALDALTTTKLPDLNKGSPVFRNPDGTPKTNATGRLYSLEKLSPEVSRLNSGKSASAAPIGSLDLAPTLENLISRIALKSGLDPKQVEAVRPLLSSLGERFMLQDVRFGELLSDSNVDGKTPRGLGTISGPTRKLWLGVQKAEGSAMDWYRNMLVLTAHEAGHLVEHLSNKKLLDEASQQAFDKAEVWKSNSTPETLQKTLLAAMETMLPSKWHTPELKEMIKTSDGDEALATLRAIHNLSMVHGEADQHFAAVTMPSEARGYLKVISDVGKKFIGVVRGALYGLKYYDSVKSLKTLSESFMAMRNGIKKASETMAEMQKFVDFDPGKMEQLRVSNLEVLSDGKATESQKDLARFALGVDKDEAPNRADSLLGKGKSEVAKFFEPIDNLAAHVPTMEAAFYSFLDVTRQAKQAASEMLAPLFGKVNHFGDQVNQSPKDLANQKMWVSDKKVNEAISKLVLWQQYRNERGVDGLPETYDFEKHEAGLLQNSEMKDLMADPKTRKIVVEQYQNTKKVESFLKELAPEQRDAVKDYYTRKLEKSRVEQAIIRDTLESVSTKKIAQIIALKAPELFDSVKDLSRKLYGMAQAYVNNDVPTIQALSAELTSKMPEGMMSELLPVASKLVESMNELEMLHDKRPGFTSLIRMGDYIVDGWVDGKQVKHAIPARNQTEAIELSKQLQSEGIRTKISKVSRGSRFKLNDERAATLEQLDLKVEKILSDALSGIEGISDEKIKELASRASISGNLRHAVEVHSKLKGTEEGRSLAGAEELDLVAQDVQATRLLANAVARWESESDVELALLNPKIRNNVNLDRYVERLNQARENYQLPDSEFASKVNKVVATSMLAGNAANHAAELFQPFTTVMARGIEKFGLKQSYSTMKSVLGDVAEYYVKNLKTGTKDKESFANWKDPAERLLLQQVEDAGLLHNTSISESLDEAGHVPAAIRLQQQQAVSGKPLSYVTSAMKSFADSTMRIYANLNAHNAKISLLHGYRMLRATGVSHEEAVPQAILYMKNASFAGDKATRSITPYSKDVRTIGSMAMLMQRFTNSWVSMGVRQIERGFAMGDSQLEGLGYKNLAEVRTKNRQAAAWLFGTQVLAAGVMGVPFFGAATKILEDMTGKDLRAQAYINLHKFFDKDAEEGGVVADSLMHGFLNTMLAKAGVPVDLGGRFAIGGGPGFSEYSGFDPGAIYGPTGGLIKTILTGVSSAAKDGNLMPLTKSLVPTALKKAVDLAANGDMTDANQNKMGLTKGEKILYGLGFTPSRINKLKLAEKMTQAVSSARRNRQDKVEAEIVDKLGSPEARALITAKAQELGISKRELAASVADRVVKKEFPKDFRSSMSGKDAESAAEIMHSLGLTGFQNQETKKAQVKNNVLTSLGLAPNFRSLRDAREEDEALNLNPFQPIASSASRSRNSPFQLW